MNANKRIDFESDVFEEKHEHKKDCDAIPRVSVRRKNPWLLPLVSLPILVISGLVIAMTNGLFPRHDQHNRSFEEPILGKISYSSAPGIQVPVGSNIALQPSSMYHHWCDGEEMICTTINTATPISTLQKLIPTIPAIDAKRYKIRLSVEAIEEPPSDNSENDEPVHPRNLSSVQAAK